MNSPTESKPSCGSSTGGLCELEENLEILRSVPIFSGVPLQKLKLYAYLANRTHYKPGEFLFHQKEADDRGYILLKGKAQMIREYTDHSLLLRELNEGDFIGGLALLSEVNRLFSVKAITPVECLTLDRESFRKIVIQFPDVAIKMIDVMIKNFVQMEEKLLETQFHEYVKG